MTILINCFLYYKNLTHIPPVEPPTGKRVAVIGAGSAGLSACYYILQRGYSCEVSHNSYQASIDGVFAAGKALQPGRYSVKAMADGRAVAVSVHQYLRGEEVTGLRKRFHSHGGVTRKNMAFTGDFSGAGNGRDTRRLFIILISYMNRGNA